MNREEAIARGMEVHETQHSMKRRSPWHDYCRKGTYMLTLVVEGRMPLLGRLVERGPSVETEGTVAGYGTEIAKVANMATVPSVSTEERRTPLFEPGYSDNILLHEGQLDNWKAYLDDNPRRLLVKRQNPQLFTVLYGMEVAEHQCQVVGNRFLLDIPDKMAVIVHRRYTEDENARLRDEWLACGERGGVLVSAAISPKEKEVLREAMNRGYRIILLRENGFPKLYKPSGESFDVCSKGLLLQISPWDFHMEKKIITRAQCLELNAMAERIAKNG